MKRVILALFVIVILFLGRSAKLSILELNLNQIPNNDYVILLENNWTIIITDEDLSKKYDFNFEVSGVTDYKIKTIYIKTNEVERALLHEVGHVLDFENGQLSKTEEFKQIFKEEQKMFIDCTAVNDKHEILNEQEYFASVYQNIILNYDDTSKNVPKTVKFIKEHL